MAMVAEADKDACVAVEASCANSNIQILCFVLFVIRAELDSAGKKKFWIAPLESPRRRWAMPWIDLPEET